MCSSGPTLDSGAVLSSFPSGATMDIDSDCDGLRGYFVMTDSLDI